MFNTLSLSFFSFLSPLQTNKLNWYVHQNKNFEHTQSFQFTGIVMRRQELICSNVPCSSLLNFLHNLNFCLKNSTIQCHNVPVPGVIVSLGARLISSIHSIVEGRCRVRWRSSDLWESLLTGIQIEVGLSAIRIVHRCLIIARIVEANLSFGARGDRTLLATEIWILDLNVPLQLRL